ncbi:hypothetical protein EV714DRAFT_278806 [Schizophyllum commune]
MNLQLASIHLTHGLPSGARIADLDASTRHIPALVDTYNRRHDYLRISLTERCNLRCFYCMPEEGIELSPTGKVLTDDEVVRLAELFVRTGVTKIRLTGGEPTVRKGITDIIARLNSLRKLGLKSIAMTSNGIALHRKLPGMVDNGLTHLNLSLDTLDPNKFMIMTRRRGHEAVLRTLDEALHNPGLQQVKLNIVVIKGLNDAEVLDFIELTKDRSLSVRFIEFMPFTGNKWDQQKMLSSSELLERISQRHPDIVRVSDEANDTARSWALPGYKGSFGFISSMSDHFCATCNRLRITADGNIKVCLFDAKEISLRDRMRAGATDAELLELIRTAVLGKQEKHSDMQDIDVKTNRPMILIDQHGHASMVDVGDKAPSSRSATATGRIIIPSSAYELVTGDYPSGPALSDDVMASQAKARRKGDALTVAQLAAIMASKKTSDLIPLCHPLPLTKVDVRLTPEERTASATAGTQYSIFCEATVKCEGKTGVEMEALTAVSVGLLTVWDMLKAVAGKEMEITDIKVTKKSGGRSGDFTRGT